MKATDFMRAPAERVLAAHAWIQTHPAPADCSAAFAVVRGAVPNERHCCDGKCCDGDVVCPAISGTLYRYPRTKAQAWPQDYSQAVEWPAPSAWRGFESPDVWALFGLAALLIVGLMAVNFVRGV